MHLKRGVFFMLFGLSLSLFAISSNVEQVEAFQKIKDAGKKFMKRLRKPIKWVSRRGKRNIDMSAITSNTEFIELMKFSGFAGKRSKLEINKVVEILGNCYRKLPANNYIQSIDAEKAKFQIHLTHIFNFNYAPKELREGRYMASSPPPPVSMEGPPVSMSASPMAQIMASKGSSFAEAPSEMIKLVNTQTGQAIYITPEQLQDYKEVKVQETAAPAPPVPPKEPYNRKMSSEVEAAYAVFGVARTFYDTCVPQLKELESFVKRALLGDNSLVRVGYYISLAALISADVRFAHARYVNRVFPEYSYTYNRFTLNSSSYFGAYDPRAINDLWVLSTTPNILNGLNKSELDSKRLREIAQVLHTRLSTTFHGTGAINILKNIKVEKEKPETFPFEKFAADISFDVASAIKIVSGHNFINAAKNIGEILRELLSYLKFSELVDHVPVSISLPCTEKQEGDYIVPLVQKISSPSKSKVFDHFSTTAKNLALNFQPQVCLKAELHRKCKSLLGRMVTNRFTLKPSERELCDVINKNRAMFAYVKEKQAEKYMEYFKKCFMKNCVEPAPREVQGLSVKGIPEEILLYLERAFIRYMESLLSSLDTEPTITGYSN